MRRVAGIDVGGTFTDLLIHRGRPGRRVGPPRQGADHAGNQAFGVLAALEAAGVVARRHRPHRPRHDDHHQRGARAQDRHASGSSPRAASATSLELGRRTRPQPYGMTGTFEPLIPRELRLEVAERMDAARRGA